MTKLFIPILITLFFCFGCQNPSPKTKKLEPSSFKGDYKSNVKSMVSIQTFDHYKRHLNSGYGFYVSKDLIIAPLDLVKGAYKVKAAPLNTDDYYDIKGFVAYRISSNLVVLKSSHTNLNYVGLKQTPKSADTVYQLYRKDLKLFVSKAKTTTFQQTDSLNYWTLNTPFPNGKPVFSNTHQLVGISNIYQDQKIIIAASEINQLVKQSKTKAASIYDLRTKTNKVYPSYKSIKGFRIITNKGSIELSLFNETPVYRDNFIKLVSDQFYDSLLIHRVINDFLIQTGAADSKYAKKDDVVGWQGPGYTLPMQIVPKLFHQRGMIAASKLPADRNKHNRSDGSQFYIVKGRLFNLEELQDLEKKNHMTYTKEQRRIYSTIGGAPYLDGDYTVFAKVTKGMEVVDQISTVKTYAIDRPIEEIRIKTIEVLWK